MVTGPGDSGRDLGLEQKLREGEGQSAWSPRLCPGLPGSHSSSVGSEVRATPILYGFFPGGVHEAPREHMQLHRPLAWAEVDAPCFACLVRGPGCRPQPAVVLVFLQPLSQPESPAPGPPGRMDLEPPPQPLFGTPASQPKKEPPGYEEAVSQQPRPQVKRVARGLRGGWSQSPGSHGRGPPRGLGEGVSGQERGWAVGAWRSPRGPDCWLGAGRVCSEPGRGFLS